MSTRAGILTRRRDQAAERRRRPTLRRALGGLALSGLAVAGFAVGATLEAQQPPGKALYDKWCAECHGSTGAGDGSAAAYMLPRPRDFTRGVYQIRTTASGELPTDADITRIIEEGMPGSAMPAWKTVLDAKQTTEVVAYLKSMSSFFAGAAPTVIASGRAPSRSAEAIAAGRDVFDKLECFKCHGRQGRGDGTSAPTLKDDDDYPIRAADLTEHWKFNGGASVEQIYMRLRTGLDGTPMPSFSDAMESNLVTDEQLWQLAMYVRSLSPERDPEVRDVMRAARATGALPTGPADSAWAQVDRYWIPLVGQVVLRPRWFAPTVDGVWVQAMHDGTRLAMRISWDDPSRSPDPAWDEWLGRIRRTMTADDSIPVDSVQHTDRLIVQFPARITDGVERPYFLGGDSRQPVYAWRWTSDPDAVQEGRMTGLGTFSAGAGSGVTHAALYDEGAWSVQFTRDLASSDTTSIPRFGTGVAIPVAFYAADGSNGENESRGAVGAWYAIYLDIPTPPSVYVAPAATMLLTAGLGVLVVATAQRRERAGRRTTQEDT